MELKKIKDFWYIYKRNRTAEFGLIVIMLILTLGILADNISPYTAFELSSKPFQGPSSKNIFGTDDLGRDIFSQIFYAIRISFIVGFCAAFFSFALGVMIGSTSGYYGGVIDNILMRVVEIFQVIPTFFFAIVVVAILGGNIFNIIFIIGFLSWPSNARLIRAEFLSLKQQGFVEASRALGDSDLGIILEILPNAMPPVIINSTLQVGRAIVLEAGLSFLGLGDPKFISLGYMLQNAQKFILYSWHLAFFPGLFISLMVLGINLIGDGLNDALNPRLRKR